MNAKASTTRESSSNSSLNRTGETGNVDNQATVSPANESNKKTTVANQRYESYRVAFYGTPSQKEAYRQQIRSQLKDQVKEKDDLHRRQLIDRVAESDTAVANDQKSKQEDNNMKQKKADYLKQFSNENKKIMEEKEKSSQKTREANMELERKLLNVNPINWNMTLH
ncbi:uncharacterized protein LOC114533533 [Dendronephthya gigantea]|uniref:uncharacterized protein LOC114533533 n=1 Tax=Dendronephthya gigantea TaxID=151771 RepID=UPI00106C43E6|nr:uncharacterized protein LOC114533533 [Dendronephthya gigantea]